MGAGTRTVCRDLTEDISQDVHEHEKVSEVAAIHRVRRTGSEDSIVSKRNNNSTTKESKSM